MINLLKGLSVDLKATGPTAVLIAWITAVTLLGIFGEGFIGGFALGILSAFAGMVLVRLAARA